MRWKLLLLCAVLTFFPRTVRSQTFVPTDVGDVGIGGSATESNGQWTVEGAGADIWGTADSFQFAHLNAAGSGVLTVRVLDLQNTNIFAKAGITWRRNTNADSAMVILDVTPGGGVEFMRRPSPGAEVSFLAGGSVTFPVWLRLAWSGNSMKASVSQDGSSWTLIRDEEMALQTGAQAGLAVTSHDRSQLTDAHFDHVSVAGQELALWNSFDVGAVGRAGSAAESNGVWTVSGAGDDVWGAADGCQFLYHATRGDQRYLMVRVNDLQNTSPYAKAGLMMRATRDADAPTVILDVRPTGEVEFMSRAEKGAGMVYLGGTAVTLPVWLRLEWAGGGGSPATVRGWVSQNKTDWSPVVNNFATFPLSDTYDVGVVVTSHDTNQLNTAHVQGLTLLPSSWLNDVVGTTGLIGNAVLDLNQADVPFVVQGAGADIWGQADSFQFLHPSLQSPDVRSITALIGVQAVHPFAKAGVMFRASLAPDATSVVFDARPGGELEFMVRLCTGCETLYVAGATVALPAFLTLTRDGSTFTASVFVGGGAGSTTVGSFNIDITNPIVGYVVTSHDPGALATGTFANPPR